MAEPLISLDETPTARVLLAGWRRQWSDGGNISSGMPRWLIEKLSARRIGRMEEEVSRMCFPFQIAGTHDMYRPRAAFDDGLPTRPMQWDNGFWDAGNGVVIFLGIEPWYRIDLYGQAFFEAVEVLGNPQVAAVEGYNGPAPPELERRISCVYSKASMADTLREHGMLFSSYGSQQRQGPTIGMALVNLAHYQHPDVEMVRVGAMAPMFPFSGSSGGQLGITTDHRAFYDIMRRLRALYTLDIDLADLRPRYEEEASRLQESLDRVAEGNDEAKRYIDRVRNDYHFEPFEEPVALDPGIEGTLADILGQFNQLPGEGDETPSP
jgi:hypothetical protein